jgi:hypothetical protein
MPSNYARTISYFSLGGLLLGCIVFISLWGPETGLLQDAYRAESERLFQSFAWSLAKATAQNDDLAQIDELRRLQRLPEVASAEVNKAGVDTQRARILIWEGKPVGHLDIRLHKTRWRLWRYRWFERILSLCILFLLTAGGLGIFWIRFQGKHKIRVIEMLHRAQRRSKRKHRAFLQKTDEARQRWIQQSFGWTVKGLLALDGSQRIVAINNIAQNYLKLTQKVAGTHWLDHVTSPEWVAALRQSIANPGARIPLPESPGEVRAFLMTFPIPGDLNPESTWIVFDTPSESVK